MAEVLLKLADANGNLKGITTSEQDYLAYQAGLQLADADSAEVGSLTRSATGSTSIGSFSDTAFDQAIGTHPGTSITTSTTTTTVYQKTGTASEAGSDFHRPVALMDDTDTTPPQDIKVMNDTRLNTLVNSLISTIFTNDYPGTYRLGTSAPSGDYATYISGIFTDTRTDGTSVTYNLYKRNTYTPPTAVNPLRIANTFDLKEMSDAEIKYTLGQRAKTQIMSTGVGKYQLRSSVQGVPSDPGTWVAKGTATDTKTTTADVNYTRTSQTDYQSNYDAAYIRNYEGNYINTYSRTRTSAYTTDYVGYSGAYVATYISNYEGDYISNYEGDYTGANYEAAYDGTFYESAYEGAFYESAYDGTFYDGADYQAAYEGADFQRTSFLTYQTNYQGNYIGDYLGNFQGTYVGDQGYTPSVNYQRTRVTTFINFFSNPIFYGGRLHGYFGSYGGYFEGNFLGDYVGVQNFQRTSTRSRSSTYTNVQNYNGRILYFGGVTVFFAGNYLGDFGANTYDGDGPSFVGSVTSIFTRTSITPYTGDYQAGYLGNYIGNFLTDYQGTYQGTYISNYVGDYISNYVGTYLTDYEGTYITAYESAYQSAYESAYDGDYVGDYTGDYIADYEGNYDRDFVGDYEADYIATYISNYTGDYTGDFSGETIQAPTTTVETYTLYVRTS